jgi:hypothetical protein
MRETAFSEGTVLCSELVIKGDNSMQKSFLRPSRLLQVGGGSLALMAFLLAGQGNAAQAASHKHSHSEHGRHYISASHHFDRDQHARHHVPVSHHFDKDQHAFKHDKQHYAPKDVDTTYRYHNDVHADVIAVTDNYRNDTYVVAVTDYDEDEIAAKHDEKYCLQDVDAKYRHHKKAHEYVIAFKHDKKHCFQDVDEKYKHHKKVHADVIAVSNVDKDACAYKHDEKQKARVVDTTYKRHNNVIAYKHGKKHSSRAVDAKYRSHKKVHTNVIASKHGKKHSAKVVSTTYKHHKNMRANFVSR